MNNKIQRLKKIIKNILKQDDSLYNREIYSLLDKFKNSDDDQILEQDVILEYNRLKEAHKENLNKVQEYNKAHNYNNVFFNKGIYTINDLYKYMNDNFEYGGVLIFNNERIKLPFGPVNGVAKNNILTRYQDEDIVKFILDFYGKLDSNNETVNYVKEQYYKKDVDVCNLKEYQQIIYKVSGYVQKNMWRQRNVLEILNDQISNCYESSFLIGEFLKLNGIKYQKYIIGRYDNIFLAHMFITYCAEDKWYYFEHALRDFKGIYEYNSKEEMEQDIFSKFIYNDNSKMVQDIDFDNYFLKPINDLDPNGSFNSYFEYFDTIESVKLRKRNYDILMRLTDLVFKEYLSPGAIYINNTNIFYDPLELPKQLDYYDIELWKKKVFHILRKHIINIGFYNQENLSTIYTLNPLGGFAKYDNIIDVEGAVTRSQLLYSKKIVSNIYTVNDLKRYLSDSNIMKVKDILMFTLLLINKKDLYEYGCYFATELSKEALKLINNDSNSDRICIDSNIDLCGNIIDTELTLSNDNFLTQITAISSSMKVIIDAIKLVAKKDYQHDLVNTFIDYLVYMLDISSIDFDKIKNENQQGADEFKDELTIKLLNKLFAKLNEN